MNPVTKLFPTNSFAGIVFAFETKIAGLIERSDTGKCFAVVMSMLVLKRTAEQRENAAIRGRFFVVAWDQIRSPI